MCWVLCNGFTGISSFNLQNKCELFYPQFIHGETGEAAEEYVSDYLVSGRIWMQIES